ncbi:MAG: Ku protein [Phycisphaerales bacterium]|nr:Ku protein [Phycisphaerales bacterium]
MVPRPMWKGQIRLSLVSFPVRMHNAVSTSTRVSFNQLHKDCHRRLKQQMVCPEHGPVDRSDIEKGYEYEKGKYVVMEDADLEKVRIETNKTIELVQFVDADALDPVYLNSSYYIAPDGPMGQDAFAVVREAMERNNKVAIGRMVIANRENIVALRVEGKGFVLTTLRYADEVRPAEPCFEDIKDVEPADDHIKLAEQLIQAASGEFEPNAFKDRYQDAMMEVIKAKIDGAEPIVPQEEEAGAVINLMDALKASVASAATRKPPAESKKSATSRRAKAKKRA